MTGNKFSTEINFEKGVMGTLIVNLFTFLLCFKLILVDFFLEISRISVEFFVTKIRLIDNFWKKCCTKLN